MLNLMMEVQDVVSYGWLIDFWVKIINSVFKFFNLVIMNLRIIIKFIDHRYF